MKVCIFDTETTGLPVNKSIAGWRAPNNWPHLVSISWAILDGDTNKVEKKVSYIIYPHDWVIPKEASDIHRITQEIALERGYYLENVMEEFLSEKYDVLVAHNMDFDRNVLFSTLRWDMNRKECNVFGNVFCTMAFSRNLCKIPSEYYDGYKAPKLSELYRYVFGREPDSSQLHGSHYDVQILTEIVQNCGQIRIALGLPVRVLNRTNASNKGDSTLVL
jgi:DNA polymerase III epsilon subunit-like protein